MVVSIRLKTCLVWESSTPPTLSEPIYGNRIEDRLTVEVQIAEAMKEKLAKRKKF